MLEQLEEIKSKALGELEGIDSTKELEAWQICYLGRKSELTGILRSLATVSLEERKVVGARANAIKASLEASFGQKKQALLEGQLAAAKRETVDVTLPGRPFLVGHLHPINQQSPI